MSRSLGISLISVVLLFCGCSFREIGRDVGDGLAAGVDQHADSLASHLGSGVVRGATESLTNEATRKQLQALIDSLGHSVQGQVSAFRDSLFGEYLQLWLKAVRDDLLGSVTRQELAKLRDELLGANTRAHIASIRDELLGDSTRALAGALRDELLGPATRAAVDSLVEQAIASLEKGYRERIRPIAQEDASWVQRNVTEILILVGLIIAALIVLGGIVYMQKKRYRNVIKAVAREIEDVEDKAVQEKLKRKIEQRASRTGVEPDLHAILQQEGI